MGNRNVIFVSDDRGADYVTVAIVSLLKTVDPAKPLTVNLLAGLGGFSSEHRDRLAAAVARFPFAELKWRDIDAAMKPYAELLAPPPGCQWNILTWAGFFAPSLMPEATGSAVYFDIDTFVCEDVSPLFDLPMDGRTVALVSEDERGDHGSGLWRNGIMPDAATFYYNSGLVVFNLEAYRKTDGLGRMMRWFAANKGRAKCLDQDALNAVFWREILPLPEKWNHTDGWTDRHWKYPLAAAHWRGQSPADVLEAIAHPAVLHFWGGKKPWKPSHRPERRRYHAVMRELGLAVPRDPRSALFYDVWYAFTRRWAAWRKPKADVRKTAENEEEVLR